MNQLACNQLVKISRLANKLNLRTCSNQLNCLIRSNNNRVQSNGLPSQLAGKVPIRTLSQTPAKFMQEKPKPDADSKSEEPVLIGKLDPEPDSTVKVFCESVHLIVHLIVSPILPIFSLSLDRNSSNFTVNSALCSTWASQFQRSPSCTWRSTGGST